MLGVNSDKDRKTLEKTLADEQISWRSWWDEGRIDGPIHTEWQILQRPAIHILDHQGVIRFKNIDPSKVDAAIDGLLANVTAE
jgi:hypothetical protein